MGPFVEIPSNIEPKPAIQGTNHNIERRTSLKVGPLVACSSNSHLRVWALSVWPVKMTRTQAAVKMTGTLGAPTTPVWLRKKVMAPPAEQNC